ncbi:D-alanyl-D-alanine carboxypeptidase family protein [Candidatus Chlamydia sanziniae]|uniref:D-alanyl-D-alanine carboxypeptidase n=1 Tax=Candidatus Chlamydia sanziniae TaxID=1806891 RepID=A0A1A9HWQ4_9CHLA|nr:D-alanyl-D-alanine carboxypeptidase family protein [Candidatus Chlamydia sanziniae]ANH78474.1 D-alanyl-D-alanine carboxypeptidase [Candidatus Chlamydia sanziniae]
MRVTFFKYGLIILCGWFLIFPSLYADLVFPEVRGATAAVIDVDTGKVFYNKDIDTRIYPASMTKIATALFILKQYPEVLDRLVTVKKDAIASITPQAKKQSGYRSPPHWLETDGMTIQLQQKEELLGWDLFHALLIYSANDAANALAIACCSSVGQFMEQLNTFLKEIGCYNTHFNNPHGLHHPNHFTTTRDLACIMRHALKEAKFRQVIATRNYKMATTNLHAERNLFPTNKLILPGSTYYYSAALGGKTGTTKDAGKNLIMAAQKKGRSIVTIATGYFGPVGELYQDIIALCETLFNEPLLRRYLIPPLNHYVLPLGKLGKIAISLPEGIYYDFYPSEGEEPVSVSFVPSVQTFPVQQGELLGHWIFYDTTDKQLALQPLYAPYTLLPTMLQNLQMYSKRVASSYRTYIIIAVVYLYIRRVQLRRRKASKYCA